MNWKQVKRWVAALPLLIFGSSCTIHEPGFSVDSEHAAWLSRRTIVSTGNIKKGLIFFESQAREAGKNAASSWTPEYYWQTESLAYQEAGIIARVAGQLEKSIAHGRKGVEIAEKAKNPHLQVRALIHLLDSYRSVRSFDSIEELIEKGLTLVKDVPLNSDLRHNDEGNLYRHLGLDFMRRGEHQKAVDAFNQALYLWRAILAGIPGRYQTAIQNRQDAIVLILSYLASNYHRAGKLNEALEHYGLAFKSIQDWGLNSTSEADLYQGMGEVYLEQKNFASAVENFKKALTLSESQQNPASISASSHGIGEAFRLGGEADEAVPYYQKAIEQVESVRSLLQSEQSRQSYFEGGLDAYVGMMEALRSANKSEDAFHYSERARSRALLDLLGSKAQLSRVASGLIEEERALQEHIAGIKAQLPREEDEVINEAALRNQLADAERTYTAFLSRVRRENKEQASLMNVEPLTLKRVQDLLDPDATMLEYFVAGNNVWLWVVEKDRVEFVNTMIARKDLVAKVTELRDAIYQLGEKERFNVLSQELHKVLIQRADIRGKELIIVPHDVLHYLPFHALQSSDGRYLVEKYPIYYLSSASLIQFTQEKRRATGEKVLAFGNPDLGDPEKDLEYADLEAQEIKSAYPQSAVYLKGDATEEKAKALSPNNDIIHFATHAELKEDDPLSSAILLAKSDKEDGRLEVREIFGMNLKADLVVLSGCETGLGKLSTGDELVGLTRAFIYAGTPSVVASLWKVDDSSTAHLMASFYRNLTTMTKVEALRQAQLQLIRGNINSDLLARRGVGGVGKLGKTPAAKAAAQSISPDSISVSSPFTVSTSHPYFWAPFILVGDGK